MFYAVAVADEILIRLARPGDLPAILALEQSAPTAAHWSEAVYRAMLLEEAGQRRILLLAEAQVAEAHVAGFAVAASAGREWELENIVVAVRCRGQGIGKKLLNAIVERARAAGSEELHAEVRASNPAIERFYKPLGFTEAGRRIKYYTLPPEDAVLLRLLISRP